MTKVIIGLLVVCLSFLGSVVAARLQVPTPCLTNLQRAFAATGATRVEISMNGWAELPAVEMTEAELAQLLREACQAAFGAMTAEVSYSVHDSTRMARAAFTVDDVLVEANAQQVDDAVYLVATLRSGSLDVWELQQALSRFFAAAEVAPRLTTCVVGVTHGRLSPATAQEIVGNVLQALEANMLDFYSDGGVVSLTASSRMLPPGLSFAGRHTNLSLMMRYDEQYGKTWFWLAWPTCAALS